MKITSKIFAALAVVGFITAPASGDTVTWQSGVQMYPGSTTQTFVDNSTGTFVLGFNGTGEGSTPNDDPGVDGSTATTVNGVDFQNVNGFNLNAGVVTDGTVTVTTSTTMSNDSNAFGDGTFSSDGDIFALIAGGLWGETTVNLSGLTAGNQYMVQIFSNDSRSGRNSDWQTGFSDGVNDFATSMANGTWGTAGLSNRDPVSGLGEPSGDYIIGTFVAGASGIQSFDVRGTSNNWSTLNGGRSQLNAFQLRDLGAVVPEPSSFLVLSLASLMLCKRRR